MARGRASTFPLSHVEEKARITPFSICDEDVEHLHSCRAFQAIRGFLRNQESERQVSSVKPLRGRCRLTLPSFCMRHQPTSKEHIEAWLLQRDITYALILPLLEIYGYAAKLAKSMLGDRKIYDLELVFRGEARGAFVWLHAFMADEQEWCMAQGCPGKSVLSTMVSHLLNSYSMCRQLRPPG